MRKTLIVLFASLAVFASAARVYAADPGHEVLPGEEERDIKKELDYKLKTSKAFLKAAKQIVEANKNAEAISYLKRAESLAEEGQVHYNTGEFKYALEDVSEATQMAIHAIILSKNIQDSTIREFVIQEEMILKERQDRERKLTMINKGIAEAEVFIKTAERLLSGNENEGARKGLKEAKALFESSKVDLAQGKYDHALEQVDRAYTLATRSVKDIKKSQGDIITFPKPAFNSEKELLAYELKKNNSYVFFASQVLKDAENNNSLREGKELRGEALTAMDRGEAKKAIEKLRASTELLIKAIKGSRSF